MAELKKRALSAQEAEEDADKKASFVEAEVHKVCADLRYWGVRQCCVWTLSKSEQLFCRDDFT